MASSNTPESGPSSVVTPFQTDEDLEREIKILRAERDELALRLAALPRATSYATIQLVEADKALLSIRQARDAVMARSAELTEQLALAEEKIAELTDGKDFAERARAAALEQLQATQSECAALRVQLREKEKQSTPPTPSATAQPAEISELTARFEKETARMQQEFEDWKTASQVEIAALHAQLDARSKDSVAPAELERQKIELAELRADRDSLREELQSARYAELTAVHEPTTAAPVLTGLQPAESAVIPGIDSALAAMRRSMTGIESDPSHLETLDVLASEFQDFAQSSFSAGFLAAHRLATVCADVVHWIRKSPSKIPATLPRLTKACDLLARLGDPQIATRIGDPAGSGVYIVDDDVDNCECIAMGLEKLALRIRYAVKAEVALNELAKTSYDLLILDVDLGGEIDGFQILERVRASDISAKTPVLFVSGLSSVRERLAGVGAEEDDLIAKPYNLNELALKVLCSLLSSRLAA